VCRAGERAAGGGSKWLGAPDAVTAARLLASSPIDIVVADSHSVRSDLQGLTGGAGGSASWIVVLTEGDAPERIQQMLDAGADCCLPKRLPQPILEGELRRLVIEIRENHGIRFRGSTDSKQGGVFRE
jgi:DNA-binding NarL/FixJ family response regulator